MIPCPTCSEANWPVSEVALVAYFKCHNCGTVHSEDLHTSAKANDNARQFKETVNG